MTILVTGAGGFLGKYLCRKLEEQGHRVLRHRREDGDLCRPGALEQYRDVGYVFHLAARTFVPESWEHTYDYYQANVMGTVNVLEFCRKRGCGTALMSSYVYGEPQYLPVDEGHPVAAVTPYHQTKLVCEGVGQFYAEKFHVPVTVFRPFNIYGAGQDAAFLIPVVIRQLLDPDCEAVSVLDLAPRRDYIHAEDAVEVMSRAVLPQGELFRLFNLGSGRSVSVEDVIRTAMEVLTVRKPYIAAGEPRRGEVSDCVADMRRTFAALGTVRMRSLREGMEAMVEDSRKCEEEEI